MKRRREKYIHITKGSKASGSCRLNQVVCEIEGISKLGPRQVFVKQEKMYDVMQRTELMMQGNDMYRRDKLIAIKNTNAMHMQRFHRFHVIISKFKDMSAK